MTFIRGYFIVIFICDIFFLYISFGKFSYCIFKYEDNVLVKCGCFVKPAFHTATSLLHSEISYQYFLYIFVNNLGYIRSEFGEDSLPSCCLVL